MTTTNGRFTFDSGLHVGHINGAFAPSTTQVLLDNGLISPEHYTEKARQRGEVVHAVLAGLNRGWKVDMDKLHPDLRGYVESGLAMHRDLGLKILEVEERRWDPVYRTHGAFDLKACFPGFKRAAILDYKTGEVEFWARYQLAEYDRLSGGGYEKFGVKLHADGSPATLVPFNAPEYLNDDKVFLAMLTATHTRILHRKSALMEIIEK